MTVCTEPLPKLRVPTTTARWWSCKAPATISLAEAEPLLISSTIGRPSAMSLPLAFQRWLSSGWRARVDTISPCDRKSSLTATAWSSRPPGLLRRSSTIALSLSPDACLSLRSAAFAPDGQRDPAVRRAAHAVDRLVQRQALHGLAVQRHDQVARLDARAAGRGVVDRAYDLDVAGVLRDLDAEAAELAAGLH